MTPTALVILAVFWGLISLAVLKVVFAIFRRKFSFLFFFPLALAVYFGIPQMEDNMSRTLERQNTVALSEWEANQCVSPDVIRRSAFLVTNAERRGHGSGFLLEGGIIGTNRHVYQAFGEDAVFIDSEGNAQTQTVVHVADPNNGPDLAFYRMTTPMEGMQALPIATEAPRVGEQLLIVGQNFRRERFYASVVDYRGYGSSMLKAPIGSLSPLTIASMIPVGIYHRIANPDSLVDGGGMGTPVYAVHGDVFPGNSGSAVVNCQGEVVGVHYAGRGFFLFAFEHMGYAVALDAFQAELDKIPAEEAPASDDDESVG